MQLKRLIVPGIVSLIICLCLGLAVISVISYRNTIYPTGIVIHHSAIPFLAQGLQVDVNTIDEFHRQRGFGAFYWGHTYHVGYHYVILPDGTLQTGRPERCRGAHTKEYNDYTGICLIGDFSPSDNPNGEKGPQQPTPAQLKALAEIVRYLQTKYNISQSEIKMHQQLDPNTKCPGENFSIESLLKQLS